MDGGLSFIGKSEPVPVAHLFVVAVLQINIDIRLVSRGGLVIWLRH